MSTFSSSSTSLRTQAAPPAPPAPHAAPAEGGLKSAVHNLLRPLASLRLTVVLLALTMVLVFAGTWAQIDYDVWTVQKRYFHSFFTWVHMQLFLPREPLPDGSLWKPVVELVRPLGFPMLGGYSLIVLLLLNLVAAHTVRFKLTRKRVGVILIHAGLILLILGEVVASLYQREGRMTIEEGQTVNFTEDIRQVELAVIDPSPAEHDEVTVIPASRVAQGGVIAHPSVPFQIRVDRFLGNSNVAGPFQAQGAGVEAFKPTAVPDAPVVIVNEREATGTSGAEVDFPSAVVSLTSSEGQDLGRFVLTTIPLNPQFPQINVPQDVKVGEKTWRIQLRWKREYRPFALKLLDFRFDRYTGTNVAKNFSSRVQLIDPERNEDREVLIRMNQPLRYAGETFFQADWNKVTERGTVLQVVRNPGWLIPYISCAVVSVGLLVHFGMTLLNFLRKTRRGDVAAESNVRTLPDRPGKKYELRPAGGGILVPVVVTLGCLLMVLGSGRPPKFDSPYDFNAFSRVPISYEGRVMPLDTLARVSLRVMSGKSTFRDDQGKRRPAIQWLADLMGKPPQAAGYEVLRIDHPDLKGVLKLDLDRKMFSLREVAENSRALMEQVQRAQPVPAKERNLYQKSVMELYNHLGLIDRIATLDTLYVAPPTQVNGGEWRMFADAMAEAQRNPSAPANPGAQAFVNMLTSYFHDQPEGFNAAVANYLADFSASKPAVWRKANFEVLFNWLEPFYQCMILYVLVFLLVCAAWLVGPWRATLMRTAYWVMILTLVIHTLGLIARVYIQGRPPVTNLYSSAIFIGWAAVVFCAVIERIYRNGVGSLAGAIVAFPSLLVAHFLAGSGDTMQMLQAVLDTNFWLATHVVVITLGYAATFLAGIIAIIYVVGGIFTAALDDERRKALARMTYGVVCFAVLFSFVGTILGGIWADQSWGRFWGWDPKENGAALLVLWNAIILHARWGGVVRERGFMLLTIFGNVVTSFSWFGTNMLGIGLHSYGFMDSAVFWLGMFIFSQLLLIGLGMLPLSRWRSVAAS